MNDKRREELKILYERWKSFKHDSIIYSPEEKSYEEMESEEIRRLYPDTWDKFSDLFDEEEE
jgi:hypothetical protein